MAEEKIFANGMIHKEPRDGAPDFVKACLAIKVEEFTTFLKQHDDGKGWVNIDLKVSAGGKPYAELNTWKPDGSKAKSSGDYVPPKTNGVYGSATESKKPQDSWNSGGSFDDDIPF